MNVDAHGEEPLQDGILKNNRSNSLISPLLIK